jgi:hypothetical protein
LAILVQYSALIFRSNPFERLSTWYNSDVR